MNQCPACKHDNPGPARCCNQCGQALAGKTELGVLLLEDRHWADAGSIEFFQSLFECAANAPLLVLCNHRSDYIMDWLFQATTEEIALDALDESAIDDLLNELLGDGDSLQDLRALIRDRSGGNPYFVEEAIRSLLERQALTGTKGNYRLEQPLNRLQIPESVQAILAARIDRLPATEKQTLHAAAVLGKRFGETLLGAVVDSENPRW